MDACSYMSCNLSYPALWARDTWVGSYQRLVTTCRYSADVRVNQLERHQSHSAVASINLGSRKIWLIFVHGAPNLDSLDPPFLVHVKTERAYETGPENGKCRIRGGAFFKRADTPKAICVLQSEIPEIKTHFIDAELRNTALGPQHRVMNL